MTPSPSASASVSPSASRPAVVAADGADYAACADGTCEVAVAAAVRITLSHGVLAVTRVDATVSMDFELNLSTGATGSGTLRGTCGSIMTFYLAGGISSVTCDASGVAATPRPVRGAVSMQLLGWAADGAAVLRLVSG